MKPIEIAGAKVSAIGLGTAQFGAGVPERDAFAQLDRFVEAGNLVDTAHVYSDWIPGETSRSERVIGRWLHSRGGRARVFISTKGAHPRFERMDVPRLSPGEIESDLLGSLKCLQTDYIDLYFLHRDDPGRPVGEILETLEAHRRAGRIRAYGCSNWTLGRLAEARDYAAAHGMAGFCCNQLLWSLAAVNPAGVDDPTLVAMDGPTWRFHRDAGLPAMAYMAAAGGWFAHRQRGDTGDALRRRYDTPENEVTYARLLPLSRESGLSLTALSLAWFAAAPFPAAALASFSRPAQLEEAARLLETELDPTLIDALGKAKGI